MLLHPVKPYSKYSKLVAEPDFEHFEERLNRAKELMCRLHAIGVSLSVEKDGLLTYDAPIGAMTDSIVSQLRENRDALLSLIECIDERAAIMIHDGGMSVEDAQCEAIMDVLRPEEAPDSAMMPVGVNCPFCSNRELVDDPGGMRCRRCGRLAWILDGRSIVRADFVETDLRI